MQTFSFFKAAQNNIIIFRSRLLITAGVENVLLFLGSFLMTLTKSK